MMRSELYARVWALPVLKVGLEVGLTGTRVAAICKQHGIPTPPRGYWAKLGAGKRVESTPLPHPEADYEIRIGAPARRPKASPWVAPGVLLRPGIEEAAEPGVPRQEPVEPPVAARPQEPLKAPQSTIPPAAIHLDLLFIGTVAAELQSMQAIRELLRAVMARAVHAPKDDANYILNWAARVRDELDERDPVAALLRIVTEHQ